MKPLKSLRRIRHSGNLSLRRLGELAGVSYVTIARIETGIYDPRLSTLQKLAKALKVTVAQIIEDHPFHQSSNQGGKSDGAHKKKRRVVRRVQSGR